MTTRTRALATTLVLVLVAAGALLALWLGIVRRDEAREARGAREARLFSFQAADVTGLTVTAKGDVTRIVRAGDGWRIESPVQAEADRAAVTSLVDRVAELRRTATVPADGPEARSRYGLAKPRASVALTLHDGKTESLALGDESSFDGRLFVSTGGVVALVPGDLKWAVERSTLELRDRTVMRFDREAVATLRVRRGAGSFDVRRDAAPAKLPSYLWTLSGLKAKAFVDEAGRRAGELGLDRPTSELMLLGKDGQELGRLTVSAPRGGVTYARSSGPIVELEPSALEPLPKSAKDAEERPPSEPPRAVETK